MQLRILGPLELRRGDERLVPTRRRAKALLGMLALRPNTPMSVEWIIDGMWPERPPRSAPVNLRSYLADLRRLLPADSADGPRIDSGRGMYVLAVGQHALDTLLFDTLAGQGQRYLAEGRYELAVERLTGALGLWRGEVLEGVPMPEAVRPAIRLLDDRRVDVLEDCVEARLEQGQHVQLAAELRALTSQHPMRERLWGQLMLALYRSGRQGEAVGVYRQLYRLLDEELGVRPSHQIEQLHLRMLRADPALRRPEHVRVASPAGPRDAPKPWQLPPDVTTWVGRSRHLHDLDRLVDGATGERTAVVVAAVSGTAGVGKTALAVHWAHRAGHRFPDGCLYADLRGYGADPPLQPAEVLTGFLRGLGMAGAELPHELAELTGLYRTLLAGRRMLVVLDNARTADQVRPLLPGAASCFVVVTSRDDLAGLVARDGAHRVALDLLPVDEAVALLRGLIGARVDAEPDAARALAECCARLPLALRVAAELAAGRPATALGELVTEIVNRQRRLDVLDAGGDPRTAVRVVFDWSYQSLDAASARAFRLLGLHPGHSFDAPAVAALTATSPEQARPLIDRLLRAHLVQPVGADRYGMHDLLRAYAAERAAEDPNSERRAALAGLLDHYASTSAAACDTAFRTGAQSTGRGFDSQASARSWLDVERPNLVVAAVYAAENGWPGHAIELSRTLGPYLDAGAHHRDALTVHSHARRAARDHGDRHGEGAALGRLGIYHDRMGQYRQALDHLRRSLTIREEVDDQPGQAAALNIIAAVYLRMGCYSDAVDHFRRSLVRYRQLGDLEGEGTVLSNLPLVYYRLGRYAEAMDCSRRALRISLQVGDRAVEGWALGVLGLIHARLGHHGPAIDHGQQALDIFREIGHRTSEGLALTNLGVVHTHLGQHPQARARLEQALRIHRDVGDRACEADALNNLGNLHRALGELDAARADHERAVTINREIGERFQESAALNDLGSTLCAMTRFEAAAANHRAALTLARDTDNGYERARALDGLARVYQGIGDQRRAAEHWRQALAGYTGLGVPEARQVRASLAEHAALAT